MKLLRLFNYRLDRAWWQCPRLPLCMRDPIKKFADLLVVDVSLSLQKPDISP